MRPGLLRLLRSKATHARRVLRERWVGMAMVGIVFVGIAAIVESRSPRTYIAYAVVSYHEVLPGSDPLFLLLRPLSPEVPEKYTAARIADLAGSAEAVAETDRRLPDDHSSVAGRVQAIPTQSTVAIGVFDADPRRAATAANVLAEVVSEIVDRREIARLDVIIDAYRTARRRPLKAPGRFRNVLRAETDAQITRLLAIRGVARAAELIDPAVAPEGATFIPGRRIWMAAITGLSLGLIAIFVMDALARRPRDPRRLAAAARLHIAALLPRLSPRRPGEARAAFDRLRFSLRDPSWAPGSIRTVLVTSPIDQTGKTTVALGLAEAAAAAGYGVCLVEGDLRRPALAERLDLQPEATLVDVLLGRADVRSAVVPVDTPVGGRRLNVLPAAHANDSASLLHLASLETVVDALEAEHDLVVIDAPSLLMAVDVAILARQVDAILLCARAGGSTVDELAAAADEIDILEPRSAGLVILDTRQSDLVLGGHAPRRETYSRTVSAPEPREHEKVA